VRLGSLTLLLALFGALWVPAAPAGPGRPKQAGLRQLWSAFPLNEKRHPRPQGSTGSGSRPAQHPSTNKSSSSAVFWPIAAACLTVAVIVGMAMTLRRKRRHRTDDGEAEEIAMSSTVQRVEGGHVMTRPGRKLWSRGDDAPVEGAQTAEDADDSDVATSRIAAYTAAKDAPDRTNDSPTESPEPEPTATRSTGEEVDTILRTAREAATKLTQGARDEAARIRAEATAKLEGARRQSAAEREHAARERADAESYATRMRRESEGAAEKVRAKAEREAAGMVEAARAQVANADAEIEQKFRDAEKNARSRVESLQTESKRHEERLRQLLTVLRGMSSQVEAVLEGRGENGREDVPEERLDEALRADARSEPVA
jgi:hypothetical protein